MYKISSISLIVIISLMLLFSCKKNNAVDKPVNKGTIKGMVSGTAGVFDVSNANVWLEKTFSTEPIPQPIYTLSAIISQTPYKVFSLTLKGPLNANAYGIGSKHVQASYQIGSAVTDFYKTTSDSSVISGLLNLTTYTPDTLIGTYQVTVFNTIGNKFSITSGSFNCTFIN